MFNKTIHTCSYHHYSGTEKCPLCKGYEISHKWQKKQDFIGNKLEQAKRIIKKLWEYKNQWNAQTELINRLLRESKEGIDYDKLKKENEKLRNKL